MLASRSYFSGVVDLRAELFSLWERGGPLLSPPDAQTMRGAINRVPCQTDEVFLWVTIFFGVSNHDHT